MLGVGAGKRVRFYLSETDRWHGQPLYLAILDRLRADGCAGATVFRGIAGFGVHARIHTISIEVLSADLPLVLEWIDSAEQVERVLPAITSMVGQGMITVDETAVVHLQHRSTPPAT